MEYINNILIPKREKLEKENERLKNQIEMFQDMVHNYNLKYTDNELKIQQINIVLNK